MTEGARDDNETAAPVSTATGPLLAREGASWANRWTRHLDRLGGMLVSPRATSRRLLTDGQGTFTEVFFWMVVLAAAVSPIRTGRAVLLSRVGLLDGLSVFATHLQGRLLGPMVGVLVAAALLAAIDPRRSPDQRLGFSRAIDVVTFALVPVLLLTTVGLLLRAGSIHIWFLPHQTPRGPSAMQALYVLVSYGWSFVLWAVLAFELRRLPRHSKPQEVEPGEPSPPYRSADQAPRT